MKKLFFLPLLFLLLTSCQGKREICADAAGRKITYQEAGSKLGLGDDTYWQDVRRYCEFYQK